MLPSSNDRFLQRNPSLFLSSPLTTTVLDLACAAVASLEAARDATESITKFLSDFLVVIKEMEGVKTLFLESPSCPKMTHALLSVLKLPTYFVPLFADVIYALLDLDRPIIAALIAQDALFAQCTTGREDLLAAKNPKAVAVALRTIRHQTSSSLNS
jgi:hypothetical protein